MRWALALVLASGPSPGAAAPRTEAAPPTGRGGAGERELLLDWDAPGECPSRDAVEGRVEGMLGRRLVMTSEPPVRVVGRVAVSEGGYRLRLSTETTSGALDREFEGRDCDVLADTAAIVVSATLSPDPPPPPRLEPAPEPRAEAEPAPSPQTEPVTPATTAEPEPRPATPPEPSRGVGGAVRVAGGVGLGALPGVAPGVDVAAALLRRSLRVELRFAYWFARRAESEARSDAGAELTLWTLGARGCWAPARGIFEFPLCGGVQAGPLRGDGYGISLPTTTRLTWVAVTAGAALAVSPLRNLAFWLGVDLLVPLTRPRFVVEDLGALHTSSGVGGRAMLGVEGRFGASRPR